MGREAECDSGGLEMEWKLGVSEARTPLRVLIARESGGSLWADGGDLKSVSSSPGRKRGAEGRSGSGSPVGSLFGARMGHVSHKIRLFKKAQAIAERPVQLGALFAQESRKEEEIPVGAQPLRDLIAAELCGGPVTDGRSPRSPSMRSVEAAKAAGESQELRYLFAKDWALQTSDEEDEFWDSGSLCGAAPVLSRSLPRRQRSRFYKNEKLPSSTRPVPEIEIVRVQELRIQSPQSLGTLLSEEIATSSGSPLAGPRWSSTPAAESSRRVKIGSLDDISAPVRPESQSQLDFLIAKILTLRTNSNHGGCSDSRNSGGCSDSRNNGGCSDSRNNGSCSDSRNNGGCSDSRNNGGCSDSRNNGGCSDSRNNGGCSDSRNNGGCSDSRNNGGCSDSGNHSGCPAASGSMQTPADVTVGEELRETDTTPATDVDSSIAEAPNILLEEIKEPTPPSEAPTPSTPITEAAGPLRDGGHEEASTSPDRGDVEAQPRVQLGTLLERTWGEHGWLPIWRGSPLPVLSRSRSHREEEPPGPSPEAEAVHIPPAEAEPVEAPEPTVAAAEAVQAPPAEAEPVEAPEPTVAAAEASVEAAEAGVEGVEASVEAADSRPPTRVSLLSLLNQDMETDEDGLQADVRGRRDEPEEDEVVTEELDPMCCVCMVGHKGAAFIPCGHTFCRKCCREVRRSIGSCPLCNQAIVDVLKLY